MGIIEALEERQRNTKPRSSPMIDKWLAENPDNREELESALRWFAKNRSRDFGWSKLVDTLHQQIGFPGGDTLKVRRWAEVNMPDLDL